MSQRDRPNRQRSKSPDFARSGSRHYLSSRSTDSYSSGSRSNDPSGSSGRLSDLSNDRRQQRNDSSRGNTQQRSKSSPLGDLPSTVSVPQAGELLENFGNLIPRNAIGKPIYVRTNHFRVQSLPGDSTPIYVYSLQFDRAASSGQQLTRAVSKREIARAFFQAQSSSNFLGPEFAFDGVSRGYSRHVLVKKDETKASAPIDLPGHTAEKPHQIIVRIRGAGTLQLNRLVDWLRKGDVAQNIGTAEELDVFNALTAIFRDFPVYKKGWKSPKPSGSAFFNRIPELTSPLPSTGGILEAIRGVHQAVTINFGGKLCVNVDNACSAFWYPNTSLLVAAKTIAGIHPNAPIGEKPGYAFLMGCERLVGSFFVLRHTKTASKEEHEQTKLPVGHRTPERIRVKAISAKNAISSTFMLRNESTGDTRTISVAEHYDLNHGVKLEHPTLPLIETEYKGRIPLELAFFPEGERYTEPLQGQHTADFIKICTAPASVRRHQIREHLQRLEWHKQPLLNNMGISVETSMLKVRARMLPIPTPQYARGTDRDGPRLGFWNLKGKAFTEPSKFKSWGLIYFPSSNKKVSSEEAMNFARYFAESCLRYGMDAPSQPPEMLLGNTQGDMRRVLEDLFRKVCNTFHVQTPDLILVLLHQGESPSQYKAIKNVCELAGITSQVMIVERSVWSQKGKDQYLGNIALKINVKLGGLNHKPPQEPFFSRPIMMIGADISHPSPEDLRELQPPPSYAAVVGSYDLACAKYTAVTSALPTKEHIIDTMLPMLRELLKRFHEKHRRYPEKLIYWRDGLGDSQIEAFRKRELHAFDQIRQEDGLQFKLTVFNCVKRHKTRFFPEEGGPSDRLGNVLPATAVENTTQNHDFYTVTQAALQGCCVPTHYIALRDEIGISPEVVQRLVVNSCFAYQRATRSIKVVPAVYYADQVALRARMHLRPDEDQRRSKLEDVGSNLAYTMYWQ